MLSSALSDLTLVANAVFSNLSKIFNLYTAGTILVFPFALWLLRKIVNLVRKVF